jgi:NADH-quinone oxidoreductase subunit J
VGLNDALFAASAALALLSAMAVVFTKRTQYAALFFVTHLMSLAAMYALLSAPVLAALQVAVYGGAIVVVFIFAIMILDADELEKLMPSAGEAKQVGIAGALGLLLIAAFFGFANRFDLTHSLKAFPEKNGAVLGTDNMVQLARVLYRDYLFAFELTGILLLVAVVGIMVMAKRNLD